MDGQGKRPTRTPSRCVFIGNIAYDTPKEKLKQIFSEVGPIVNFRMVYDRESGKPKGYAFCEYKDESSAMSAMRNLNDRDLNGRKLRVDFADNNKINMPGDNEFDDDIMNSNVGPMGAVGAGMGAPNVPMPNIGSNPMNAPVVAGMGAPSVIPQQQLQPQQMLQQQPPPALGMRIAPQQQADTILSILQKIPPNQLYDAVSQMKDIVMTDPDKARQIFAQNPTLAIVMLDIQYILGMLKQPFVPPMIPSPGLPSGPIPADRVVAGPPFHPGPMVGAPAGQVGMGGMGHPGPMMMGLPPRGGPMGPTPPMGPGPMGMGPSPHPGMGPGPHPGMGPPMGMPHGPPMMHGVPQRMTSPHQNPYSAPHQYKEEVTEADVQNLLALGPESMSKGSCGAAA